MYIKTVFGYILEDRFPATAKGLLDIFIPEATASTVWKHWRAVLDGRLCPNCLENHGKIYAMDEWPAEMPPLHEKCRCAILRMEAIIPGGAAKDGRNGAD